MHTEYLLNLLKCAGNRSNTNKTKDKLRKKSIEDEEKNESKK